MDIERRLEKLKSFYRKFNRLPSYAEMLRLFKVSSKNAVSKIVDKFIDEGFLKKNNRKLVEFASIWGGAIFKMGSGHPFARRIVDIRRRAY